MHKTKKQKGRGPKQEPETVDQREKALGTFFSNMEQILLNNGVRGDITQQFVNILTKSVEQTQTPELIWFGNNMKDALGVLDTREKRNF